MKLSFVIPAYNEEGCIVRCLDSIIREIDGRPDAEIIVVDNNSTDTTCKLVARYQSVKLLHEPQKGANRARQTGFEASQGELVAFIDADTEMPRGWVARAESTLLKNPDVLCLSGPFRFYDLPVWTTLLVRTFYLIAYVIYSVSNFLFQKTTVIQGGNYILRRWALEKIGGQNVALAFYGDDTDLAVRLSKIGKVKFTFRLPIDTSGRRLAKEGVFVMAAKYGINNLWTALFKKPFTTGYKEIRLANNAPKASYEPESAAKEWAIGVSALLVFLAILAGIAYLIYVAYRHSLY